MSVDQFISRLQAIVWIAVIIAALKTCAFGIAP